MEEKFTIVPGYGVGELKFGLSRDEVKAILGSPEDETLFDEPEIGKTVAWNYWRKGISVYFEEEDDYRLGCMEVEGGELFVWDENVYGYSREKVMELASKHGISDFTEEKDDHSECLSMDSAGLNFFFEEDEVISVQAGVLISDDEEEEACWPL